MPLYRNQCYEREPCLEFESNESKGEKDFRSEFRKDFGRLLHSACFRRLQGKTQLFPGFESDFFRNRLTHSLEVSQIATGLAIHLNQTSPELQGPENAIDYDLVEFAAHAHDLGHPPFGHNGEEALHLITQKNFGYEGNAQTLRILTTLEKRYLNTRDHTKLVEHDGKENRSGLNLTYRTLASVLKYDHLIPKESESDPIKGYYDYDKQVVKRIKEKITGQTDFKGEFKTLECHLMDVADDIAYSTYDFEDSLKAGFLHILDIFSPNRDIIEQVAQRVTRNVKKVGINKEYTNTDILGIYFRTLGSVLGISQFFDAKLPSNNQPYILQAGQLYDKLKLIGDDGYLRTNLTSKLVHHFINGINISFNKEIPALSKVYLNQPIREEVEVLKNLIFVSQIDSPKLKIASYRGKEIIDKIYNAIHKSHNGSELLPEDFRKLYKSLHADSPYRQRIVVDFIAGMTDRYAIEFYGRLTSENPQTIFKPL